MKLIEITKTKLKKILATHEKWINGEPDGKRADLYGADLYGANLDHANLDHANLDGANLDVANLYGANLDGANLYGANLYGANLCGASLYGANLYGANLYHANLDHANLCGASLYGANLDHANLYGADLYHANLYGASLYHANLDHANLYGANLDGANLDGANLDVAKNIPFIPYACPDFGSFIGYKKAGGYIVELKILSDAKRCSATGRKCRCDKAKVLSIQDIGGTKADITEIASDSDKNFIYKIGEIVSVPDFCTNRWNECSKGIHFFINRQEAVNYN